MNIAAFRHTSHGAFCYPLSATHLRLIVMAEAGDIDSITVLWGDRYWSGKDPAHTAKLSRVGTNGELDYWAITIQSELRRFWYCFGITSKQETVWLGEDGISRRMKDSDGFQYAYINSPDIQSQPTWLSGTTFYGIFPDRFANGDTTNDPSHKMLWGAKPEATHASAGGDIAGIIAHADHLATLGIGGVYTTPLFQSVSSHKYDTEDYYSIDQSFGTNELFEKLVETLHEKNISLLLDGVFNHCGHGFFAFQDVLKNGDASPYRDWFIKLDNPPEEHDHEYDTFSGAAPTMPKLNTANPDCAEYLLDVVRFWTQKQIDGWRLDVANEVDSSFWRKFRTEVLKIQPDGWILGEVWHDATDWLKGDQLDSIMNYPWRKVVINYLSGKTDARQFAAKMDHLLYRYPAPVISGLLNLLGSHDTARIRTELDPKRAILAAILLLTSPGVPLIYYGDEIGLEGENDPGSRACMDWDIERWDIETYQTYQRLIKLRKERGWLNDGAWQVLCASTIDSSIVIQRTNERMLGALQPKGDLDRVVIIINPEAPIATIVIQNELLKEGTYWDVLSEREVVLKSNQEIQIAGFTGMVLVEKLI